MKTNTDNWYQLPPDFNAWQQLIIANIARKCPTVPALISNIDLPKIDPVAGSADGLIVLDNGIAVVPITIRECKLAPLDTMITRDQSFFPLTDAFLSKLYANNVLAEVGNPPDTMSQGQTPVGPARKIKLVDTISQMKYASKATREKLREKIASSNEVHTFFRQYRPEYLEALSPEYDDLSVKEASSNTESERTSPLDLIFISNDPDGYHINGHFLEPKIAGMILDDAGATYADKKSLMDGGFFCIDNREKLATLVPTLPDENMRDASELLSGRHRIHMVTAFTPHGVPMRGFMFTADDTPRGVEASLFVGDDCYAYQDSFKVADIVSLSNESVMESMVPEKPTIGSRGVLINKNDVRFPVTVTSVFNHGITTVISYTLPGEGERDIMLGVDFEFYSMPDNPIKLMKEHSELIASAPGYTYTVRSDHEGNIILGDKRLAYNTALYSIMKETGLSIDDALDVTHAVKVAKQTVFKIAAADDDKKDDKKGDKNGDKDKDKDKDKSSGKPGDKGFGSKKEKGKTDDKKGDKDDDKAKSKSKASGSDSKPKSKTTSQSSSSQSSQQQDPYADMEVDRMAPRGADPLAIQDAIQSPPDGLNFEDIQDIAKVNDPELMDTYLSGNLAGANPAGREELMKASDDTINAIKSLGKLLFKVRLGQIDYVKESDIQTAINKMNDVCSAIGIASTQVNTPDPDQSGLTYPSSSINDDSVRFQNFYTS